MGLVLYQTAFKMCLLLQESELLKSTQRKSVWFGKLPKRHFTEICWKFECCHSRRISCAVDAAIDTAALQDALSRPQFFTDRAPVMWIGGFHLGLWQREWAQPVLRCFAILIHSHSPGFALQSIGLGVNPVSASIVWACLDVVLQTYLVDLPANVASSVRLHMHRPRPK